MVIKIHDDKTVNLNLCNVRTQFLLEFSSIEYKGPLSVFSLFLQNAKIQIYRSDWPASKIMLNFKFDWSIPI